MTSPTRFWARSTPYVAVIAPKTGWGALVAVAFLLLALTPVAVAGAQVPTTPTTGAPPTTVTPPTEPPTTQPPATTAPPTSAPAPSTTRRPTTTIPRSTTTPEQLPTLPPVTTAPPAPGASAVVTTTPPIGTEQDASVSPWFPALSIAGFVVVAILFATQWFLTRKPGRGSL